MLMLLLYAGNPTVTQTSTPSKQDLKSVPLEGTETDLAIEKNQRLHQQRILDELQTLKNNYYLERRFLG